MGVLGRGARNVCCFFFVCVICLVVVFSFDFLNTFITLYFFLFKKNPKMSGGDINILSTRKFSRPEMQLQAYYPALHLAIKDAL